MHSQTYDFYRACQLFGTHIFCFENQPRRQTLTLHVRVSFLGPLTPRRKQCRQTNTCKEDPLAVQCRTSCKAFTTKFVLFQNGDLLLPSPAFSVL